VSELLKKTQEWAIKKGLDLLYAGLLIALAALSAFVFTLIKDPNSRWLDRFEGAATALLLVFTVSAIVARVSAATTIYVEPMPSSSDRLNTTRVH
jgi:hypothetical protein